MKQGSTLFLKGVILLLGAAVLTFCIFALPVMTRGLVAEFPILLPLKEPILFGLYLTAVPFFIALYHGMKLLSYIDKDTAFSKLSVKALGYIKYCALIMSGLYLIGMPVVFLVAESDDAPGLIIFGLIGALSPTVIATFAAVLQKLVKNAIEIKSENELTV